MPDQLMMFNTKETRPQTAWRAPEALPELSQHKRVWLDTEGTGLDARDDKPIGASLALTTGQTYYLPWGHRGGGNLDERLVKRWAERELRDKDLVFLNAKHDNHQVYNWGVDLEKQGNRLHDVSFKAALLNENRYGGMDLDSLGKEYVGRGKQHLNVDKARMQDTSAGEVGPYAEEDALLVRDIDLATDRKIAEEDLTRVLNLEDALVYCVCEMERHGMRLDMPKLIAWHDQAKLEYGELILEIWRRTGMRINPTSTPELAKLFDYLKIEILTKTGKGALSVSDGFLKSIDHPIVKLALRARWVDSVRSKYLAKYLKAQKGGVLHYVLHQLKTDPEGHGTITGRFSSTGLKRGGANIQQVTRVQDQLERFPDGAYCVRELFIADDGTDFFATDASQIEFRLFAHYANSERINRAYEADRKADFHNLVLAMIQRSRPDCTRRDAKEGNFAKIYGSGVDTLSDTLNMSVEDTQDFVFDYEREFPEAKRLMNSTMNVAQHRGYVRTALGRRGRFPDGERHYRALNKVLQGGAADLNKLKLLRVYRDRVAIGIHKLRASIHDEIVGDADKKPGFLARLDEVMNIQEMTLRVPIIWESKIGNNWKECK